MANLRAIRSCFSLCIDFSRRAHLGSRQAADSAALASGIRFARESVYGGTFYEEENLLREEHRLLRNPAGTPDWRCGRAARSDGWLYGAHFQTVSYCGSKQIGRSITNHAQQHNCESGC
jgi:hypothetical protein